MRGDCPPTVRTMQAIKFWDQREEFGWMSNFHNAPIYIAETEWKTSEHYYQAQKHLADEELVQKIADAPTAAKAKRLAKKKPHAITEQHKILAMRNAIYAKFTQHPDLKEKLIATGSIPIYEDSPHDEYWGTGEFGNGLNMMGLLLMELRCQLQQMD